MESSTPNPLQAPPRDSQVRGDDAARQFVRMSRPQDNWEAPTFQDLQLRLQSEYTEQEGEDAWSGCQGDVRSYYETLLKRWQKEMDNLLVFGGLFAAVLTPFTVESYKSLQPDPTDPSLAILQQISAQLNSFTVNSGFVNSTTPSLPLVDIEPTFHASDSDVSINKLWFSSLICTLASSSIALIVKQWLHELAAGLPGTSRAVARRRQYRYNALRRWHVEAIVVIPSFLLQVALILFLSGLLVLLQSLDHSVATISSVLSGALFLFLTIVTVLPTFASTCCYGSPLARLLYIMSRWIIHQISGLLLRSLQSLDPPRPSTSSNPRPDSTPFARLGVLYYNGRILVYDFLYSLLQPLASIYSRSPTWRSREDRPVLNSGKGLDCSTAVTAFTTTFDEGHIKHLSVVLQDLPATEIADAFSDIVNARWGPSQGVAEPSYLEEQHILERPLTRALGYLITDPQFGTRNRFSEMAHIAPACASLLRRLNVTESTDRNGVLGVLGPAFDLHDEEVTRLAYDILLDVLNLFDTGPDHHLSYVSIRYALSALEEGITAQWDQPENMSYDLAITRQLKTVRGIILCALEALSPTLLSLDEARIVCDHASRLSLIFMHNWSSIGLQEWQRLLAPSDGEKSQSRHSLPLDLQQYLWYPLLALLEDPRSCIIVPEGMPATLKAALSQARTVQEGTLTGAPLRGLADLFYNLAYLRVQSIEDALKELSHRLGVQAEELNSSSPRQEGDSPL